MSDKTKSPWSIIDSSIGELAASIVNMGRNDLAKLHMKYQGCTFDEPVLDIFVRRDEILTLFEEIKKMRVHPQCTLDGISVLIERANFKIKNIRTKINEVVRTRTERYSMQTKPN